MTPKPGTAMTSLAWIQERHEIAIAYIKQRVNGLVVPYLVGICTRLRPNFNITQIKANNGKYKLVGDRFAVIEIDVYGEPYKASQHIDTLFTVQPCNIESSARCAIATAKDTENLRELQAVLDWWFNTTGGHDVEIPN